MADYQYDAFISYRHRPTDMAVAMELQRKLEAIKKPNGKKLRIFRDKTDLPICKDLGKGIEQALEGSEFLIVICSPDYRESQWCMAELAYFRKLHGDTNANILPVLVAGEPEEAFPRELLYETRTSVDQDGNVTVTEVEVEPLGADIHSDHILGCLWKLQKECFRVAAPILNKSFDELYQRRKRRQRRTMIVAALLVIGGLTCFSMYNLEMLDQIQAQHEAMQINESLRLAAESEKQLSIGSGDLAMALALRGSPTDMDDPERPIVEEAEAALRSAVYTRMVQEGKGLLQPIMRLKFDSWNWTLNGIYRDGKILVVSDTDRMYLYDAQTGMLLFDYPSNFFAEAVLNEDASRIARFAYCGMENGTDLYKAEICDTATGQTVFEQIFPGEEFSVYPTWDLAENVCYFPYRGYKENAHIVVAVKADGTVLQEPSVTVEQIESDRERFVDIFGSYHRGFAEETGMEAGGPEQDPACHHRYIDACLQTMSAMWPEGDGPFLLEGEYYVDYENRRVYMQSELELQVYAYQAEALTGGSADTAPYEYLEGLDMISPDGNRALFLYDGATIRSSADLTQILLQVPCDGFRVTPDLLYMLAYKEECFLQFWSVEEGLLWEIHDPDMTDTADFFVQTSVSSDGAWVAYACQDGSVKVCAGSDGALLRTFPALAEDAAPPEYMELEGERLLLVWPSHYLDGQRSAVLDIHGKTEPSMIEYAVLECADDLRHVNHHLTADGLVMFAGSYLSDAVDAIYDIGSGSFVFRQVANCSYDEQSKTLIYLPADPKNGTSSTFHGARIGENGVFEDVYTVTPSIDTEVHWLSIGYAANGKYFLLSGADGCSLYDITDGTHVMTIQCGEERFGDNKYFLGEDCIYDGKSFSKGKISSYPLMTYEEVVAQARTYLTSELGTRELSYLEEKEYFLE